MTEPVAVGPARQIPRSGLPLKEKTVLKYLAPIIPPITESAQKLAVLNGVWFRLQSPHEAITYLTTYERTERVGGPMPPNIHPVLLRSRKRLQSAALCPVLTNLALAHSVSRSPS